MGKIVFADIASAAPGTHPDVAGRRTSGATTTSPILADESRPIWLWRFDMDPGAVLAFDAPGAGHVVYVGRGAALAAGQPVEAGGAVFVEHGASVEIEATADDTVLLDFHEQKAGPGTPGRGGGGVHIVSKALPMGRRDGMQYALLADALCPNCSLWLHHVEYRDPHKGTRHLHTEDEVILVVGGTIHVGTREMKPGAVVAVDEGMLYSFNVQEDGGAFINFRPADPGYVKVDRDGRAPTVMEREVMASLPRVWGADWRVPAPLVPELA